MGTAAAGRNGLYGKTEKEPGRAFAYGNPAYEILL